MIFDGPSRLMELIEAGNELWRFPLWILFDASQPPFPQGVLPGQSTEDDRHLKTEENAKQAKESNQNDK